MAKSPINSAGSRAGRGFRYQDAVGALLAVQAWVGASPFGAVIPEAHDDFDLRAGEDTAFAQAKSRRREAGTFSLSDVAVFISELWDRHEAAAEAPDSLILMLERGATGLDLVPWRDHALPAELLLAARLGGDSRRDRLAGKTTHMNRNVANSSLCYRPSAKFDGVVPIPPKQHAAIHELTGWISSVAADWCRAYGRFEALYPEEDRQPARSAVKAP